MLGKGKEAATSAANSRNRRMLAKELAQTNNVDFLIHAQSILRGNSIRARQQQTKKKGSKRKSRKEPDLW